MKKLFYSIAFIFAILISSCSTSDKVASNGAVQKRKYNKGFFIDKSSVAEKVVKNEGTQHKNQSVEIKKTELAEETASIDENFEQNAGNAESGIILSENETASSGQNTVIINTVKPSDAKDISNQIKSYEEIFAGLTTKKGRSYFKLRTVNPDGTKSFNVFAMVSLILGAVGLFGWLLFLLIDVEIAIVLGIALGIGAIVLGAIGLSKDDLRGMAITGLILGAISAFLAFVSLVIYLIFIELDDF